MCIQIGLYKPYSLVFFLRVKGMPVESETTCEINFRTNQLEPEVLKTYLPESYSSWVFLRG